MNNKRREINPILYIFFGIAIVAFIIFLANRISSPSKIIIIPTSNPYLRCISWRETEFHDGEFVCVIGKITKVINTYDEITGNTLWGAYFSNLNNTFHVVSVGKSLDKWQGECIVIQGQLQDRSKVESQYRDGPWMINAIIIEIPSNLCQ
jgi:hypothetical protein